MVTAVIYIYKHFYKQLHIFINNFKFLGRRILTSEDKTGRCIGGGGWGAGGVLIPVRGGVHN